MCLNREREGVCPFNDTDIGWACTRPFSFCRLVSVFENKILSPPRGIRARFRDDLGGGKRNFSEFVDDLLGKHGHRRCTVDSCHHVNLHWRPASSRCVRAHRGVPVGGGGGGCFRRVTYVVGAARCGYCKLDYDLIGKVETFAADAAFVFRAANLGDAIDVREAFRNYNPGPGGGGGGGGGGGSDKALSYFSSLTPGQKESLSRMYRTDFEMFGYSPDEYM